MQNPINLTDKERTYLIELRRRLHSMPEISGEENQTASIVIEELEKSNPDILHKNIGGNGVLAVFDSGKKGPCIMLRAELDALPVTESSGIDYRSKTPGKSHACGHDGHMATLLGVARYLKQNRPETGKVVLLFQPSEETGEGAARMLNDPVFRSIDVDHSYAFHNLPGFRENELVIREQTFASASAGMIYSFKGETSHAAHPDQGRSPAPVIADIITFLGEHNQPDLNNENYAIGTVIYAEIGEKAFGTSPGEAEIGITFRAASDNLLNNIRDQVEKRIYLKSKELNIAVSAEEIEPFRATVNDKECVQMVITAAENRGMDINIPDHPFPWSEDFGRFSELSKISLFGLGAGLNHPHLHAGNFDFNDVIIEPAVGLFIEILSLEWGTQ
jgi:amidohydrolase